MSPEITSVSDLQNRLKGERVSMVTTVDEHGELSARPLTIQRLDDHGDLWFLVDQNADWVRPAEGASAGATVVDDGDTWASFAGRATFISDPDVVAELGGEISELYLEDGAVPIALRLVTDRVEWWTAPGKIAMVLELAKAKISDSKPKLGHSGTLKVGWRSYSTDRRFR